ncbi:MAG TPA: diguanylate cyclase [Pyrinomonadaceae bacterium]|nr:diguanylate cyclase [Pyrinomonadaceae bacterium]
MSNSRKDTQKTMVEKLADESGLAICVVDENNFVTAEANNNSMCRELYASKEFAPDCAAYCGKAHEWAQKAGEAVAYECYAGLNCLAVPFNAEEKPLVAIVGRNFLKASNYREATARAISGDWTDFPPTKFFENVLLGSSMQPAEKLATKINKLGEEAKADFAQIENLPPVEKEEETKTVADEPQIVQEETELIKEESKIETAPSEMVKEEKEVSQAEEIARLVEEFQHTSAEQTENYEKIARKNREEAEEIAAWRSLFGSLLRLEYRQACVAVLDFLAKRYELSSMIWLERKENRLVTVLAIGSLEKRQVQIGVPADDARLLEAAGNESSLEMRERKPHEETGEQQTINLFPIAVGGEVRSALVVGDFIENRGRKKQLARFCQTVASELEILRLREELFQRDLMREAVTKFNENLKKIDSDDFWLTLTQISAEMLKAERASLLVYNEKTDELEAKAAVGVAEDLTKLEKIGDRVAKIVLREGRPMIVADMRQSDLNKSPAPRKYRTESFISYPISIGERKIAVLNFTDRADSGTFSEFDLELLQAIAPQIAVAIDRESLKDKAGEFEQLSVTDALTGLLNRRYLEERLLEEIKRSNRHGYPMSFLMIDVDNFKQYNDRFLHIEGDKALKLVASEMRVNLRGADVAARYGGEEFSILLPQTTSEEAETIAERIRQRIDATVFPNRKVTISIGVASCSYELNTPQALILAADKALFEAKRKGKNNVQVYEKLGDSFNANG